ncbi:restriction endonuclease [Companilactobacillus sp. DQM5]|uniref:restriction endonuclease n=1 Tax=Companilactobacillus sp. DQM5 TaxID=3463359 RepID=UPI004059E51A
MVDTISIKGYKEEKIVTKFLENMDIITDEATYSTLNLLNDIFKKMGYKTIFDLETSTLTVVKNNKYYSVRVGLTGVNQEQAKAVEMGSHTLALLNRITKKVYDGFIYVDRGYFSDEAKEYAKNSERITLIDRKQLFQLMSKYYENVSMGDYYKSIEVLENCRRAECNGKMIYTLQVEKLNTIKVSDTYMHCLDCGMKFFNKDNYKIVSDN